MNNKSPKAAKTTGPAGNEDEGKSRTSRSDELLVTAIGASAGGLEAGIELIRSLDPNSGMAYVFIQHLDPTHSSIMKDLLAKETSLPVGEVIDGTKVVANHIYVIPPNALMTIDDHNLRLSPRDMARGGHMPIDHFMRSMADELGNRAIGVILSGTGSDGMLGMAEIQARGGVTFAQDPATAKYDGMPRSAIGAGCADYILPPSDIASELARLARHPYVSPFRAAADVSPVVQADANGINTVFQLLRRATRVDFTYYRKTTILRRIQRRMVVNKIDKFIDYVKYLQSNPTEIKALYQDMLIHVTSFFRNPKVFESLKRNVFPQILKNKDSDSNIRIWVPGCASGEEVYSLAISLLESVGPKAANIPIQLFGTDISEGSIKTARGGFYPANIQGDVSPQRIRRFFAKVDGGYRINKHIREMCIFAQHNLLSDPPFSRMDLICCRNLLIYFEPVLQARVVSLFHYALRPGGHMVLGTSEGISTAGNLFHIEDRESKIFLKKAASGRQIVTFSMNRQPDHAVNESDFSGRPPRAEATWNYIESQRDFDRRLLAHHVLPTIFVNEDLEIIHARGKFNRFVKIPPGRPSLNLLKMAHDDLMLPLQSALLAAKKDTRPVHRSGISLKLGNGSKSEVEENVSFEVTPLRSGMNELCFMIVFYAEPPSWTHAKGSRANSRGKPMRDFSRKRIQQIEQELSAAKEHLQSVMENQEVTNEELQSANEEILSSNEELQSTNEELETAKEELQSTNEELSTVNDELQSRNLQITEAQNELKGLLTGVDIAIVGSDSQIRTLTPPSQKFLDLLPADIGGPILGANRYSSSPDFEQLVRQALFNAAGNDGEYVVDRKGNRYRVSVRPYKTSDGKVEGHILTFIDSSVANRLSGKHVLSAAEHDDGEPKEETADK